MADETTLSPFGSARRLFLERQAPEHETDDTGRLLSLLARSLDGFNLPGEVVQVAHEAARWQPDLEDEERRALLLLVLCTLIMQQQGNTCLPVRGALGNAELRDLLERLLAPGGAEGWTPPAVERMFAVISDLLEAGRASALIGRDGERKPFILDGDYLYHGKMLNLENRLVGKLRDTVAFPVPAAPEAALAWFDQETLPPAGEEKKAGRIELAEEQKEAVKRSACSSFSIVTGGPGTGKTTVILWILRLLLKMGVDPGKIALAAPTGKAANRMGEAIEAYCRANPGDALSSALTSIHEPGTIHRLLGYSPAQDLFLHHRNNPLAEEVVIIDEASMIGLYHMERLLGALRENSRLILIGDKDQLPSVEAGLVFQDLVESLPHAVSELKINHRVTDPRAAGKGLVSLAEAINAGATDGIRRSLGVRGGVREITFADAELFDPREDHRLRCDFLDAWEDRFWRPGSATEQRFLATYHLGREGFGQEEEGNLRQVFDDLARCKILCLTRAFRSGVDQVNRYFHEKRQRRGHAAAAEEHHLLPGEPIMMLENDYERNIFNGDQGIVLRVREAGGPAQPMAVFPKRTGFAAFPVASLRSRLDLAYAMTVHKSQGSEYAHVALVLPDQRVPLLTKEILYTGVTRSKLSVAVIGSPDLLAYGAENKLKRYSGVARRLVAGGKGSTRGKGML